MNRHMLSCLIAVGASIASAAEYTVSVTSGEKDLAIGAACLREEPVCEFRGVWIPTVADERFCVSQAALTISEIKARYCAELDAARRVNANVVFFQVRPCADAFYRGSLEPWSLYLRGLQTKEPEEGFDPLQFMIDEAHKRGLQLHAWFNPFRVTYRPEEVPLLAPDHLYRREPERFVTYGKSVYFDPGLPENRAWTARVIADCVSRQCLRHVDLQMKRPYSSVRRKGSRRKRGVTGNECGTGFDFRGGARAGRAGDADDGGRLRDSGADAVSVARLGGL